jgi:acetamidase/formamidase
MKRGLYARSAAVDLRITQLVDAPNVGVTAVLPLDIFVGKMVGAESP